MEEARLAMAKKRPKHDRVDRPHNGTNFRRYFRHWKTGELMDAWKYGYWAWPLPRRR